MAERIRVAHCLEKVHSGGVERRRLSLARNLDPARFEQLLICTEAAPPLRQQFESAGCKVVEIGGMGRGLNWSRVRKAAQVLRDFEPDIVHGAVFEGVIIAAFAGSLARVPVIIAEETSDPRNRRITGHAYMRLLAALSHQLVAVSAAAGRYLVDELRIPATKVRVILNGVAEAQAATAEELAAIREQYGVDRDDIVIGTVSRLDADPQERRANKRISDAIATMPRILQRFPTARLLIVGDGPARPSLEQLASSHGIADRVFFAGFQLRPRPFVEVMDLLVHPAGSEALGLALVEAMYAARAIVATNVGGIPEVVEDGVTGLIVPPHDAHKLGDAIISLLADPDRRSAMGAAGRRRAKQRFGEDRYVGEVATLYEEWFARRRSIR